MKKSFLLIITLGLSLSAWGFETGRFGPTNTQGGTQTWNALTGSGVRDRYCITNITMDAGTAYGPTSGSACVFTIASGGTNLYVIAISTAAPQPVPLAFPPPPSIGAPGYGLCGAPGQSMTISASNCGTNYDINTVGYTDR